MCNPCGVMSTSVISASSFVVSPSAYEATERQHNDICSVQSLLGNVLSRVSRYNELSVIQNSWSTKILP